MNECEGDGWGSDGNRMCCLPQPLLCSDRFWGVRVKQALWRGLENPLSPPLEELPPGQGSVEAHGLVFARSTLQPAPESVPD